MIVQFIAPFLDHSGYGEASRNTLVAMHEARIKLTTKIVSFTPDKLYMGKSGELAKRLERQYEDYDINLIELTPDLYHIFIKNGKYNIGYFFWEVKGIDQKWVEYCNLMDEIWLSSPFFAAMFKEAGVFKPIKVIPCCMDINLKKYKPFKLPLKQQPKVVFYSIFQWIERKNPRALLISYWKAFEGVQDVLLIIKTYKTDFTEKERSIIKNDIKKWKTELKQSHYPKVYLVLEDMSYDEMMRLHVAGDIFVSAHRGEGWGYPQMTAMAFGNLIISTGFGGIHEFIHKKEGLLLDFRFTKVFGMDHIPYYNSNQQWADIDQKSLTKLLQKAYKGNSTVKKISNHGREYVLREFNYEKIGSEIKKRLDEITLGKEN